MSVERLEPDEPLYLRVKAYDGGTFLGSTNIASATPQRPVPDVPGLLKAIKTGATTVDLSWAADDYAEYFLVQRAIDAGGFVDRIVIPGETFFFTDDTVPPTASTVSYRIKAVNTAGESVYSEVAIAAPPAPPQQQQPPQRRFLISFYGADPFAVDNRTNVEWLADAIHFRAADNYGYETLNPTPGGGDGPAGGPYRDFGGPEAVRDLLAAIDHDHNREICQAEADAVDVRLLGWSLGAVEAVTISRILNDTAGFAGSFLIRPGYRLLAPIPVDDLVLIDPVVDGLARLTLRVIHPILQNVQNVRNYYQRRGGTSIMLYQQHGTYPNPFFPRFSFTYPRSEILGVDLRGRPVNGVPVNAGSNVRVDALGATEVSHNWIHPESKTLFDGIMLAGQVHHSTIVWWVQDLALTELG